jgi:hypothetical protein
MPARRWESTPERVVLQDVAVGRVEVVRIGGSVYRPAGYWTPAVHALLRHLKAVGFRYSPRVLGTDDEGREILSYIPGRGGPLGWAAMVPEDGLVRFARLLRAYHDAVRGFVPPPDAAWWCADGRPGPGELVCHGDFAPQNVVCHRGRPVGLIDWDRAAPGLAIDDVAYCLFHVAPFYDDAAAMKSFATDRPPDRRHRIEVFAHAYGLTSTGGLVDEVIRQHHLMIAQLQAAALRGFEPVATRLARDDGVLRGAERQIAWIESHRALFE